MISVPNTKYQPKDLTSLTQQLVSTIYPCSPDMRNLRNRGDGCLNARITRSSVDICFGRRFIVICVWLAYHFMLNHLSTYLRILWVPRLFVLRRVVGRVRPGGESPPRQRSFACLGQNPPTASGGPAHNRSLLLRTELVLHCYRGLRPTPSAIATTTYCTMGLS